MLIDISLLFVTNIQMKQDKIQRAHRSIDEDELEYYSFVRQLIEQSQMAYWIGNPSVQISNGTLSLYSLQLPQNNFQTLQEYFSALRDLNKKITNKTNYNNFSLLLNGVPNSKSPGQLLENSPLRNYQNDIIEMRVVRTSQLRYYAILLLFKSREKGQKFFEELLGVEYNEMQNDRIILRKISQVSYGYSQSLRDKNGELLLRKQSEQGQGKKQSSDNLFLSTRNGKKMQEKPSEQRHSCSICLEELDNQIISILCSHYFHRTCLLQWEFNTCPLCRYYQQPPLVSFCQQCNQCDGLWVCLICGLRLCCGNSNDIMSEDSHIYQHYRNSGHCLSMELQTKFLFDARVPAFLHQMFYRQLIQKGAHEQLESQNKQESKKNKLSQKISQYEQQISEQMQKQRVYFQTNYSKIMKDHRHQIKARKEITNVKQRQLQQLKEEQCLLLKQNEKLMEQIQKVEKEQLIVNNLIRMQKQKAQLPKHNEAKRQQIQQKRIIQLQQLIQQKKQDLLNFKENITIQQKLKQKLKGQKVEGQIFFGQKKKGKK